MVKKLEDELDLIIFDRKNSPIITTDCGEKIIEEAQKILQHTRRLKEIPTEIKGEIEGELNIGVIPTIASNLLHRILPVIIQKYPKLKLNITEITTQNIIEKLKNGALDLGVVSTPLDENDLEEKILYYEKLLVYGKMKNKNTKYLKPKDLSNQQMWLLEQGNCLTDQIINVCALNKKELNANLKFHPNSFDSLLNIVDTLNGLTLIPELYFIDMPQNKKNIVKDFTAPFPVREVSLIYHRPYAKQRLIEAVATEIKELITPILSTKNLKNSQLLIAKI
jgi:LysR family hydrogen peroxide-inducible transcriptional activator